MGNGRKVSSRKLRVVKITSGKSAFPIRGANALLAIAGNGAGSIRVLRVKILRL
jgi:hypothetical protein